MKWIFLISWLAFFSCTKSKNIFSIELRTIGGASFAFTDINKNKATVLLFISPDCPLSQKYTLPIRELKNKYKKDNVLFLGIVPGIHHADSSIKKFASEYHLEIPLLLDETYDLTHNLQATITPEVFVIDINGKTFYSGCIDNWFVELGKKREVVTEKYLDKALSAIVNNHEVSPKRTKAIGCFIE